MEQRIAFSFSFQHGQKIPSALSEVFGEEKRQEKRVYEK